MLFGHRCADGFKRRQESCTLTTDVDGRRTFCTRLEIFEADVLRDVVYTVDADCAPSMR
jgi:hypothetical protein